MEKSKLIRLATVSQPHGLKGEVELRLLNDNLDECVLDQDMQVWLYPSSEKSRLNPQGESWRIEKLRFGNKVLCTFEGIKDRTHLETLLPFEIHLERDAFPEADEGEVYLVDLVDLPVFNQQGEKVGKLESFSDNGMQYLFDVRLDNGEKITLPYVEAFFPKIDMKEKKIIMIMPDYTE